MLYEIFATHCTNATSIMNPFTVTKSIQVIQTAGVVELLSTAVTFVVTEVLKHITHFSGIFFVSLFRDQIQD